MSRTTCPYGMFDTCCENYDNCNLDRQAIAEAEKQKPVAWMYQCSADSSEPCFMQHKKNWAESGSGLWTETPLYTHQQPKRTWVVLTDEEIDQGLLRTPYSMKTAEAWREGVRWAYHQLKEKNNATSPSATGAT